MPTFSNYSLERLNTCDERLIEICTEVIQVYDFRVLEGHRSNERQEELFAQNKTTKRAGESKHNVSPSLAVDLAPYPIDWDDRARFFLLAGCMFQAAHFFGYAIRWGGDWNRNWIHTDQKFHDLPHFEILETPEWVN